MPTASNDKDEAFSLGLRLNELAGQVRSVDLYMDGAERILDQLDKEMADLEGCLARVQARTLQGAAVQLMLAYSLLLTASTSNASSERKARLAALLRSATRVVTAAAGIDLRAVGVTFYAPDLAR